MLGVCAVVALMASATAWGAESGPDAKKPTFAALPWVTISLGTLGVPAIPQSFLQVGSSMLTLDVVDDTHLLVTFSSRGLVPRDSTDSPDEECRMVAAELVELPTGQVLARADWKTHDHGRYLWRLGKGRFLLRKKNDLFLLTPEARLHESDPLQLAPFPKRDGVPVSAMISPDKGMVTVETMPLVQKKKNTVMGSAGGVLVTDPKPVVMIDFYRLSGGDAPGVPLTMKGAGVVRAPAPLMLPMDADGYLWAGRCRTRTLASELQRVRRARGEDRPRGFDLRAKTADGEPVRISGVYVQRIGPAGADAVLWHGRARDLGRDAGRDVWHT